MNTLNVIRIPIPPSLSSLSLCNLTSLQIAAIHFAYILKQIDHGMLLMPKSQVTRSYVWQSG